MIYSPENQVVVEECYKKKCQPIVPSETLYLL